MEAVLRHGDKKIVGTDEAVYQFVISITTGEIKFDQIVEWLKNNTTAV